jgi:hypothetical protein
LALATERVKGNGIKFSKGIIKQQTPGPVTIDNVPEAVGYAAGFIFDVFKN